MQDFRYKGLLDDIDGLQTYQALADITTPSLRDYQCVDLLHLLSVKTFVCMYDTGLGKTFLAGGFLKALKNAKEGNKFLIFTTNAFMEGFAKEITNITGLRCVCYTESPSYVLSPVQLSSVDVVVMTHGCLNVPEHMRALSFYLSEFSAIVVDELHLVSNFNESKRGSMLQSILSRFEYKLGLTATPITTDEQQLAKALHLINPSAVPDWKKFTLDIKNYGSSIIDPSLRDLFIVRQREYNNHKGYLLEVNPLPHQRGAKGEGMFYDTKGYGATNNHEAVYQLTQIHNGQRGLIYSNLKLVQSALCEALLERGVKALVINGDMSREKKSQLAESYRNGDYDVVITNITESIDLTSDYVVFYEYTSHVKQVIGRAERTLESKSLPIYILVTKETDEMDYFYRNVYCKCQIVEDILDMDLSEITKFRRGNYF